MAWFFRTDKRSSKYRKGGNHRTVYRSSPGENGLNPFGRFADAVKTQVQERNQAIGEATATEAREILSRIAVIAFVGASGTGKSTHALDVARQYNIQYLIDDGLLIHGSSIIAGSSAKRAATKIDSVRQAIFMDESRANTMRRALVEHRPAALMIIGTSHDMLLRICQQLWLNPPTILIRIEDVTSEAERSQAKQTRLTEGRHAIPVPSMEIKHEFSGYFAEPFQKLRRRFDPFTASGGEDGERTIVRPTFSTLGHYSISDEALGELVAIIIGTVPGVAKLLDCRIRMEKYGIVIAIDLSIYFGYNAQAVLKACQIEVADKVEQYTAINVVATNVRALRVDKQPAHPEMAGSRNVLTS